MALSIYLVHNVWLNVTKRAHKTAEQNHQTNRRSRSNTFFEPPGRQLNKATPSYWHHPAPYLDLWCLVSEMPYNYTPLHLAKISVVQHTLVPLNITYRNKLCNIRFGHDAHGVCSSAMLLGLSLNPRTSILCAGPFQHTELAEISGGSVPAALKHTVGCPWYWHYVLHLFCSSSTSGSNEAADVAATLHCAWEAITKSTEHWCWIYSAGRLTSSQCLSDVGPGGPRNMFPSAPVNHSWVVGNKCDRRLYHKRVCCKVGLPETNLQATLTHASLPWKREVFCKTMHGTTIMFVAKQAKQRVRHLDFQNQFSAWTPPKYMATWLETQSKQPCAEALHTTLKLKPAETLKAICFKLLPAK